MNVNLLQERIAEKHFLQAYIIQIDFSAIYMPFVLFIATTTYSLFLSYVPEHEVILSDLDQYQ